MKLNYIQYNRLDGFHSHTYAVALYHGHSTSLLHSKLQPYIAIDALFRCMYFTVWSKSLIDKIFDKLDKWQAIHQNLITHMLFRYIS